MSEMIPGYPSTSYLPGHEADVLEIGDFLLTHRGRWVGAAIRWGQRLRFHGADRPYAYWNHAALVVSAAGDLVEALAKTGATRSHISKYKDVEYTLVKTHTTPLDQGQILRYAGKVVGQHYGWFNDFWSLINYLTPLPISITIKNQMECAGIVAEAQERSGAYFDQPVALIWPADLARYYDVHSAL